MKEEDVKELQKAIDEIGREAILDGAKSAFFAAMLDGYAGGANQKSIETKSNNGCTKRVVFQDEEKHPEYIVEDEWHTPPGSPKSGGTTLILYKGTPVWLMAYAGQYTEEAIPFLKKAIRYNYERGVFNGGRGPRHFPLNQEGDLQYANTFQGDFTSFKGREVIDCNKPGKFSRHGYHEYSGMALI